MTHVILDILGEVTQEETSLFYESALLAISEQSDVIVRVPEVSLSVVFESPEKIRELNTVYRDTNKVTDVLSFPLFEKEDMLALLGNVNELSVSLGDIVLCKEYIEDAARKDKVTFSRELAYVFSHGVLHLLGYNHEEEMFRVQDVVCDKIKTTIHT